MPIQAELHDGRILEFPDGTDRSIIQGKVQELLGSGGESPILTPSARAVSPGSSVGPDTDPATDTSGLISAIKEEGPQTVGGIAGGIAAATVSPAAVPVITGVALGGGAGEAIKQIGQHLSGSLSAPKTSTEAAKRIGEAALTEAGFELVGGLVAKGFGKIIAPFKGAVKEGFEEATAMFKDKIKPVLLPAEATESRVLDVLHNVGEASIIGGNSMARFKTKRTKFFDDFADSIIDQFGKRTDPTDLGNMFVASLEASKKVHKEAAGVLYNNVSELVNQHSRKVMQRIETPQGPQFVEKMVPGIGVPTKSLKDFSSKIRTTFTDLGDIEAKNAGDDLMEAINLLPETVSFDAAKELRSRLISRVDEFSVINKKAPAIGKAKRLINLIDEEITEGLKGLPASKGEVQTPLEAWRIANDFYKHGQDKFNNTLLRRLVKLADDTGTGAENIAPAIFKPGQVSKVRKVKRALGEGSQEWNDLRGFFVQHLLQKSSDVDGSIIGKRILNNISGKPSSFGIPMLSEVLTRPQLREIEHFGRTLQMAQKKQAEGAGRMLIQLAQGGALGMMATNQEIDSTAAAVIFGPALISKMMLNPGTARLLTTGIATPAYSKNAAGVMARLVAASERIRRRGDEE